MDSRRTPEERQSVEASERRSVKPRSTLHAPRSTLLLLTLLTLHAPQARSATLIGNGIVGTAGNGLYAPLSLIPQSNPLILSNGNVAFGVQYTIQLTNGGFTNVVVAGNYTLRQGPYAVALTVPDTANLIYLTNCFSGGLYSNYVFQAAPAVYGTKVDSNDLVAGFLLSKFLDTPGITWGVSNAGGNEVITLADTSGGFSGVALTNWIGVLTTNLTNYAASQGGGSFSGVALTNWIGVLSTNATNYAASQAAAAQAAAIAQAGVLSTNITNGLVNASNVLYSYIGGGGFSGIALTNWIGVLSTNSTNWAESVGQVLTNWVGVLSTNATNYSSSQSAAAQAAAIAQAGALSTNATNFAQGIGTTASNTFQFGAKTLSNFWSLFTGVYYTNVGSGSLNATYLLTNTVGGNQWLVISNDLSGSGGGGSGENLTNVTVTFSNAPLVMTNSGGFIKWSGSNFMTALATNSASWVVDTNFNQFVAGVFGSVGITNGNITAAGLSIASNGLPSILCPLDGRVYTAIHNDGNESNTGLTNGVVRFWGNSRFWYVTNVTVASGYWYWTNWWLTTNSGSWCADWHGIGSTATGAGGGSHFLWRVFGNGGSGQSTNLITSTLTDYSGNMAATSGNLASGAGYYGADTSVANTLWQFDWDVRIAP